MPGNAPGGQVGFVEKALLGRCGGFQTFLDLGANASDSESEELFVIRVEMACIPAGEGGDRCQNSLDPLRLRRFLQGLWAQLGSADDALSC